MPIINRTKKSKNKEKLHKAPIVVLKVSQSVFISAKKSSIYNQREDPDRFPWDQPAARTSPIRHEKPAAEPH